MAAVLARFDSPPTFDDIIGRVNSLFKVGNEEEDLRIRGRFDAGDKRSHYVLMPLAFACAELVVDVCPWYMPPHSDKPIEHLTQEDVLPANEVNEEEDDEGGDDDCSHGSDVSGDDGDFDTCRVNNDFDVADLEDDEDDISVGSKEKQSCAKPSVNERVTEPTPVVQSNSTPMTQPTPVVQSIPTPMTQPTLVVRSSPILEPSPLKFFLRDYSVRHHRPYDVVHSSAKMKYTVRCQHSCDWKVITRVIQPHTCETFEVAQEHSQCTACYIARWIAALVHGDLDVSIAVVIETIKGFTNYVHCKPLISVDGTFLTRKYRGVLLIATGMDGEDRLIPLAFSLVEGENNDRWSWFSHLVHRDVVGHDRKVCIISDHHQGILNAVEDHMEGYQPIVSRWCMRHFAANIWHRHKDKKELKLVCEAKAERTIDIRLQKLNGMMNEEATEWVEEQMENKQKWTNAFDEGGARYGVQNTNISEVLNKVLKGIHAIPVYAIVEWAKASAQIDSWPNQILWGKGARNHLETEGKKAASMLAELFDPTLYVYSVRTASGLTVGGEMTGGRIYKLLHIPCSHMIATCRVRGVSHLSPAYMTQLHSKNTVLKTWESCFKPILDEMHWS
uniref:MULE transposase domain-containing protein n=1 Tax=Setaria italica TaxID=4555 RepID=K4AKD0_SETIT